MLGCADPTPPWRCHLAEFIGHGSGAAAFLIFALTYSVLGFGALPPLRVDRTGATLIGATAMIGVGALTPGEAVGAIDFRRARSGAAA